MQKKNANADGQAEKVYRRFLPMTETMFFILYSLQQERHGYGIMLHVQQLTHNRIVLGAGTIYQSLSKLEKDRLIEVTKEMDRKKEYRITPLGVELLKKEARRLTELYVLAKELV